jgi:hypothetical protein
MRRKVFQRNKTPKTGRQKGCPLDSLGTRFGRAALSLVGCSSAAPTSVLDQHGKIQNKNLHLQPVKIPSHIPFLLIKFYVMDTNKDTSDSLKETQSLLVNRETIQVSNSKRKQDGILFIVWGWVLFFVSTTGYIERGLALTFSIKKALSVLGIALPLIALIFSVYYVIKESKKVQTYIGISLRYVWISLFICMVLVNLIQFNVLHSINFELQHSIFMVLMAFAVTITGAILRYRLIIIGGVIFGILALVASYLKLQEQLVIESVAWIISFIVPGHILYANREK